MLSAISAAAVKIASENIPLLLSHHAYLQSFNIRCFGPFLFTSDVLTRFFRSTALSSLFMLWCLIFIRGGGATLDGDKPLAVVTNYQRDKEDKPGCQDPHTPMVQNKERFDLLDVWFHLPSLAAHCNAHHYIQGQKLLLLLAHMNKAEKTRK